MYTRVLFIKLKQMIHFLLNKNNSFNNRHSKILERICLLNSDIGFYVNKIGTIMLKCINLLFISWTINFGCLCLIPKIFLNWENKIMYEFLNFIIDFTNGNTSYFKRWFWLRA